MKHKKLLLIALVVVVGAYFFLSTDKEGGVTKSGEIVEINREQIAFDGPTIIKVLDNDGDLFNIAVPSMGLSFCEAVETIADVGIAAVGDKVKVSGSTDVDENIVPCTNKEHYLFITGFMGDAVYGYEFTYRKGPNGYVTLESNDSQSGEFVTGVTLMNKKEYDELQKSTDAREEPPSMNLRVYKNPLKQSSSVWAMQNPQESNIGLKMGDEKESVVGGANATFYLADGLYPTETYVVANGSHIYVLMGSYLERDSAIHKDFQDLVSSFRFTPPSATYGKLDIKAVCEGALIYMTFPSSVEADAFVKACIAGEHPEVIERFINDNNLGGTSVDIKSTFPNKIVYGTNADMDTKAIKNHCEAQGGTFNTCGSICGPDAEICATVCAFTCELE